MNSKYRNIKAISIQQPWAWALFHGKPVENRTWKTDYRGELLIHASMKFDFKGRNWIANHKLPFINLPENFPEDEEEDFVFGAIIGKVTMTDCVISHPSPWFFGPYGFVFKDQVEFKTPIPFKGKLKFFDVPAELIKE